jgi:hypothetical protein
LKEQKLKRFGQIKWSLPTGVNIPTCRAGWNSFGVRRVERVSSTAADLEQLETSIEGAELPDTDGFFFGGNSDDHYKEGDLEFIRTAREHMEMGYKIVYTSWW